VNPTKDKYPKKDQYGQDDYSPQYSKDNYSPTVDEEKGARSSITKLTKLNS
jgi:hypothetical protein